MSTASEGRLRVLTLGLPPELRQQLEQATPSLACLFEHVDSGPDALARVSAGYFAALILHGGTDPAALREQVELLSQDQQTCGTPLMLVGATVPEGLDELRSQREGGIDRVADGEVSQIRSRLYWFLELARVRRRESQLLHALAFKEQELASEIEHRRQAEQAAAHQSSHDPLTDLPNRAVFEDRLGMAVQRAQRSGGCLGVLHIDIRGFRPVNTGYGHKVGDRLLCAMARRISETIRRSDTVSRIAGDEFGVIAELVQDADAARQLAVKLIDVLSLPYTLDDDGGADPTVLEVGVRVGIATFPQRGSAAELLKAADRAVMRAREKDAREPVLLDD